MDYQNSLNGVRNPLHWRPATIEAGLEHISVIEALIRPLYPGWDRPFIRADATAIRLLTGDYRIVAERNIPPGIIAVGGQAAIMHGWYRALRTTIIATHTLNEDQITERDVYDAERFVATVRPAIVAAWNGYTRVQKEWFRRLVHNMRILNQTHLYDLRNHVVLPVAPPVRGNAFVNDNQNVHCKSTVDYIEKVFQQLRKVPIQADQKTLGEILVHCVMKPEAQVQMVRFYHANEPIYEHSRAYKRALDAVWAYIRRHENKAELYLRLAQEMNDNIGMCAQGNLSRICNVLCGYIDGFEPPVPQGTLVQNKMAAIAGDSEGDKVNRAKIALRELLVPEDQWSPWLEALE